MNITDLFYGAAKTYPSRTAIVDKNGESLTFTDLEQQVRETRSYFAGRKIGKGDRVLVFLPMGLDLYRTLLALFDLGAVAVLLDEWVSHERLQLCCEMTNCKAMIAARRVRILSHFSRALRKIPIRLDPIKRSKAASTRVNCAPDDPALLTFTTGSVGVPKAAIRSHGFLLEQFNALRETIRPTPQDVDMPVLPVVLLMNLGVGCTSVIADWRSSKPEELDPVRIERQVRERSVTRITASPYFLLQLAEYVHANGIQLDSIAKLFTGGAPVFPHEAATLCDAFPDATITVVYGSTEAEPISMIDARELARSQEQTLRGLPVGMIYAHADIRIIRITDEPIEVQTNAELEAYELKSSEIGEIIVSGEHVIQSYYNNPEAVRRNKIRTEVVWHRTGDSGYLNAAGELFLTGRCNTLFYMGDRLISPFLVEGILKAMPEVEIGTILNRKGRSTLFIELAEGASEGDVRKQIRLAHVGMDEIVFCHIPRDPRHFSKIDYAQLGNLVDR